MKIVFIVDDLSCSWSSYRSFCQGIALRDYGFDVRYICFGSTGYHSDYLKLLGFTVDDWSGVRRNRRRVVMLDEYLRHRPPCLVIVCGVFVEKSLEEYQSLGGKVVVQFNLSPEYESEMASRYNRVSSAWFVHTSVLSPVPSFVLLPPIARSFFLREKNPDNVVAVNIKGDERFVRDSAQRLREAVRCDSVLVLGFYQAQQIAACYFSRSGHITTLPNSLAHRMSLFQSVERYIYLSQDMTFGLSAFEFAALGVPVVTNELVYAKQLIPENVSSDFRFEAPGRLSALYEENAYAERLCSAVSLILDRQR